MYHVFISSLVIGLEGQDPTLSFKREGERYHKQHGDFHEPCISNNEWSSNNKNRSTYHFGDENIAKD